MSCATFVLALLANVVERGKCDGQVWSKFSCANTAWTCPACSVLTNAFVSKVIEMFHELRRACLNDEGTRIRRKFATNGGSPMGGDMSSVLSEIAEKSGYAQSVRNDVVKHDKIIKDLIERIANFKAPNMDQLVEFVKCADCILDGLVDETAVLKSFNWPKKYYIFREAKALYLEMVGLRKKLEEWETLASCSILDELKDMRNYTVSYGVQSLDYWYVCEDALSKCLWG